VEIDMFFFRPAVKKGQKICPALIGSGANAPLYSYLLSGYLHFTASEVSADDITAPISPHRTSPLAKFTAFALHRRQITPPCKSPP